MPNMLEVTYELSVPKEGQKIGFDNGKLIVPNNPIIPYIVGDGIGADITPVMQNIVDAAVRKIYNSERKIYWMKVYAGEEAFEKFKDYLPRTTVKAIRKYRISIKGPLTTPVGTGFRNLSLILRQIKDLFACVRPVRWIEGVPNPVKRPDLLNIVIFRENTEDVYAGIEWDQGTKEAKRIIKFLDNKMGKSVREDSSICVKPISLTGTKRLVRAAIQYAIDNKLPSVTLVHKGNVMKFTEGRFKDWGYEVAIQEFRDKIITEDELWDISRAEDGVTPITQEGAFAKLRDGKSAGDSNGRIVIKDRIADAMFQQLLLRPDEYSVLATMNLNGDYLSDACAAQVGGLGTAPSANINYETGVALFEATHGSAPKYAGKDKVNPSSLILSACMMLRHLMWTEAAEAIENSLAKTISDKTVTYDLARQIEGATELKCSEFGNMVIENL